MRFLRMPLLVLLSAAGLYACKKADDSERDPCLQPRIMVLKAVTARRADTGTATIDTALPFPLARPLSDQPNQYVYGGVRRIGTFSLPLSQTADSCRWTLQADTTALIDTLTFYYERQRRFLSNACGYTTFYNLRRATSTRHAIDSVILLEPSITTDVAPINLRIYY